jgi:CRP-like cAMP-binding protein
MAEFVDSTVREIDARLSQLREEVTRLEAARTALTGGDGRARRPRTTRTARPAARRAQPSRPRGRRVGNTRANQALELVRSRPGITIPEIAQQLGIEPNYLYRVMPKLVGEGQVTRQGQGWHPATNGAGAEAG